MRNWQTSPLGITLTLFAEGYTPVGSPLQVVLLPVAK